MALITLPTTPAPRSFTRGALTSVGVSRSPFTFKRQLQINQGQMWHFAVQLPPMTDAQAREWWGAMIYAPGNTFLFGDPKWKTPRGTWAGSPVVNGPGQTGQTLAMSGFTAGATVLRGDYFQHGSGADARLYCIRTDGTADGSGELQMEIWPRLRTSPADLDTLTTTSPQGVFELASPDVSQSWEPFRNGYGFDILEAIQ